MNQEMELLQSLQPLVGDWDEILCSFAQRPLAALIDASRSDHGRAKLASLNAITFLLKITSNFQESFGPNYHVSHLQVHSTLLFIIKLMRNLCAGNPSNQDSFLQGNGVTIVALLFHSNSSSGRNCNAVARNPSELSFVLPVDCLQMSLQLLGNVAQRGDLQQAAIWERFFPSLFLKLALSSAPDTFRILCMILYTCCRSSDRCRELSESASACFLGILLRSAIDASSDTKDINWAGLLLKQLCILEPFFPIVFTRLGSAPQCKRVQISDDEKSASDIWLAQPTFTSRQEILFGFLLDAFDNNEVPVRDARNGHLPMPPESMEFLATIIKQAAAAAALLSGPVPVLSQAPPCVKILRLALSLIRALCAWEHPDSDKHVRTEMASIFCKGLLSLLLGMLRALGPPESQGSQPTLDELELPRRNVYQGYRRDVVAILANSVYQNPVLQEQIRESGDLLLLLQQCMVDNENPFLREWGLWAMRNLLSGNDKNQQEIRDLEMKETLNVPELSKMGLGVEIDPQSQRPRLINRSREFSQDT